MAKQAKQHDLFEAIEEEDLERISSLLQNGADINALQGSSRRTPLCTAIFYRNEDVISTILDFKPNLSTCQMRPQNTYPQREKLLSAATGRQILFALGLCISLQFFALWIITLSSPYAIFSVHIPSSSITSLVLEIQEMLYRIAFNKMSLLVLQNERDHCLFLSLLILGAWQSRVSILHEIATGVLRLSLMAQINRFLLSIAFKLLLGLGRMILMVHQIRTDKPLEYVETPGIFALEEALKSESEGILLRLVGHDIELTTRHLGGQSVGVWLLQSCAERGYTRACLTLMDFGVPIVSENVYDGGFSLLEIAAAQGNAELVDCLIAREGVQALEKQPLLLVRALEVARYNSYGDYLEVIETLLRHGSSPNCQDNCGNSSLHYAVRWHYPNSTRILDLLLTYKGDPNLRNDEGETPLHWACRYSPESKTRIIERLLESGADPNILSASSENALFFASYHYSEIPVGLLLKHGALIEGGGHSALYAALRGYACPESVRLLLASGAQLPYKGSHTPKTPPISILMQRCSTSKEHMYEILHILLDQQVQIEAEDFKTACLPHVTLSDAWKTLEVFFENKHLLPREGLSTILTDALSFDWPLDWEKRIKTLIENGADATKTLRIYGRCGTLLHCIEYDASPEFVRYLVGKGVDVNSLDTEGCTPLHVAARSDKLEVADALLKCGATVDVYNMKKKTPLHVACSSRHLPIPAKPETRSDKAPSNSYPNRNKVGKAATPNEEIWDVEDRRAAAREFFLMRSFRMHLRSSKAAVNIVKLLLQSGADPTATDETNATPLHHASASKNRYAVRAFMAAPEIGRVLWALWRAPDNDGRLAIHYSAQSGDVGVLEELVNQLGILEVWKSMVEDTVERRRNEGHAVTETNMQEFMKSLSIDKDADFWVNSVDSNGQTVLHIATENSHEEMVEYILKNMKVELDLRDHHGRTALDIAEANGDLWIANMLRESGTTQ